MKTNTLDQRVVLLGCLVLVFLTCWVASRCTSVEDAATQVAGTMPSRAADLILVSEEDAWLVPLAAPLVGKTSTGGQCPILLVAPLSPCPETSLFLRQLNPSRRVVLKTRGTAGPLAEKKTRTEVVEVTASLTEAGFEIAKRFWGESEKVVLAQANDPVAVMLGSTLAGHIKAPLIITEWAAGIETLKARLSELKARRVIMAVGDGSVGPAWLKQLPQQTEVLGPYRLQQQIVRTIGPQQVRNVIVARAPTFGREHLDSALLVPYMSLVRKAPIVLCGSADGRKVEAKVMAFIKAHGIRPRTITLLADYEAIGVITLADPKTLGEYTVEIEPCSGPMVGGAAAFGVGRIPISHLMDASLLIARGLARERIVAGGRPRVLMIANPATEFGPLPFAETVSRVTAREFKNFRLPIDEFYGKPANHPDALKASAKAHLIIFEGHVTDQLLFEDPTPVLPEDEDEEIPVVPDCEDAVVLVPTQERLLRMLLGASSDGAVNNSVIVQPAPSDETPTEPAGQPDPPLDPWQEQPVVELIPPLVLPKPPSELNGLPLVILQSCHSLNGTVAEQVFSRGGVGLLGSTTNVHSASGSAFAKAYCDGMLYRGLTAGEALRDARNYFICLARLKAKRGHKEQVKVYRVAMSFRLWGDPEMKILPTKPPWARLSPVSAKFTATNKIQITTPGKFLPKCRTNKYVARMFPGSQAAGIVKRLKGKEHRRLMPTYFFVLAAPDGFEKQNYRKLAGEGDAAKRAVFMTDPSSRFIYLLYFPEKDIRRATIELQFEK